MFNWGCLSYMSENFICICIAFARALPEHFNVWRRWRSGRTATIPALMRFLCPFGGTQGICCQPRRGKGGVAMMVLPWPRSVSVLLWSACWRNCSCEKRLGFAKTCLPFVYPQNWHSIIPRCMFKSRMYWFLPRISNAQFHLSKK